MRSKNAEDGIRHRGLGSSRCLDRCMPGEVWLVMLVCRVWFATEFPQGTTQASMSARLLDLHFVFLLSICEQGRDLFRTLKQTSRPPAFATKHKQTSHSPLVPPTATPPCCPRACWCVCVLQKVVDFQWCPDDPWLIMSVSENTAREGSEDQDEQDGSESEAYGRKGGGALQVRIGGGRRGCQAGRGC